MNNIREYKADGGTITVCRNYVGQKTTRDIMKRCLLRAVQNNAVLTYGAVDDIMTSYMQEPQYRRS